MKYNDNKDWCVVDKGYNWLEVYAGPQLIAQVINPNYLDSLEEQKHWATANLIAAAPELLDCAHDGLELVRSLKEDIANTILEVEKKQTHLKTATQIEAKFLNAIAKATGEK